MSWQDDYDPVEDRLRTFWTDHPYGRIITTIEFSDVEDESYIVRAELYFGNELRNDPPTSTGLAHDSAAMLSTSLKRSALEVCETSAIGRALANANYAAKGKRPSREEMLKTRPESGEHGEGTSGSGDRAGVGNGAALRPAPHEHVPGKQLASGKFLCIFENPDGTVCGEPFKPKKVTVHTAPLDLERRDLT